MRSLVVVLVLILALFATAVDPSFAQAPAPKVTINGLVDFVVSAYKNMSYQANQDITNDTETSWHSRERGVFTLTGEIGRVKGVWAIELDFTNGAGNFNASSQPGSLTTVGVSANGTSANFDLDTDIQGAVETKWLYLETPVTGPGSLLPFIPMTTIGRFGGQPARGHAYKAGILFWGDFPGATFETRWAPNVRSTVSLVQISEQLDRFVAANQKDSFAILASLEWEVFKGLTVKPTYAYGDWDGGNCGTGNLGTFAFGGYNPNSNCPAVTAGSVAGAGGVGFNIHRHYLGGDVRWTRGPFSIQPTLIYLLGEQEVPRRGGGRNDVDIRSFLFDTIVGFRTGPLLIEARVVYTPGVEARHDMQNGGGGVNRRWDSINTGFSYMAGWSEIWRGNTDYTSTLFVGRSAVDLRHSASYDKYGRIMLALAADYALTPALTLTGLANFQWTDKEVDTKGTLGTTGIVPSSNPFSGGLERYLSSEWIARLRYRFAPNMVFEIVGAALIAGDALNINRSGGLLTLPGGGQCPVVGTGRSCEAENVYKAAARFRVTF